jgi:plastocyanin
MKFLNIFMLFISVLFLTGCAQVETLSETADVGGAVSGDVELLDNPLKEFTIDAFNFGYSIPEIKIRKGQKVTITLTNSGGTHDLVIDELGVDSGKIVTGESVTFDFVANEAGEFEYYCSVGNHRAQGMVGKIIILE